MDTAPERIPTLTLTVDDGPAETFRQLTPVYLTVCPIPGGFIWMAWGLN